MQKGILFILALFIYTQAAAQLNIQSFDINPGRTRDSKPNNLTVFKGKLYFHGCHPVKGDELMETSGGLSPTFSIVQEINPSNYCGSVPQDPRNATAIAGGKLIFMSNDDPTVLRSGLRLWTYDGVNPAKKARDTNNYYVTPPWFLYAAVNQVYYFGFNFHRLVTGLYVYDVAKDDAQFIDTVRGLNAAMSNITLYKGKLYFNAHTTTTGNELFSYTPGADSISLAADIRPGVDSSDPASLFVFNNKLYFVAEGDTFGRELWVYDGTEPPRRITDINPGRGHSFSTLVEYLPNMVVFKNELYFNADDGKTGSELYKYNPSGSITQIADIHKGSAGSTGASMMAVYKDKLYFSATDTLFDAELWEYDGTSPPTRIVVRPGVNPATPLYLTVYDDDLYFEAYNDTVGYELFRLTYRTLSVKNNTSLNTSINVYPNPTSGNTTLEVSLQDAQTFAIILTDVYGRTVHTIAKKQYNAGKHNITIPMQALPAGLYYYRVNDGSTQLATGKLVKE